MARNGIKWVWVLTWLATLTMAVTGAGAAGAQDARHVDLLKVEGPVTPIMISYLERGIRTAKADGAQALVVELNTPGGQTDLMNKIVQAFLGADVPVVVYVYPKGAYAASAGTLITLAAHASAMAPGTTIGAASPVGGQGEDLGETLKKKLVEDLKAQVRTLTERRGEKAVAWAESAIEEARAATAQEALDLGVIDFIAPNLEDLLQQMDGFQVRVNGQAVTLHTAGATTQALPMSFPEQFLHIITNPTVAAILLTVGLNAILFELSSPGGYAAGIVGAICLVLAFYSFGVLPVNYAGLIFIALAFVLFVVDIKAPTHGVLTVGGIVSLVAGALILFNSPIYRVSIRAVVGMALATGLFFAFAMAKVVRIQKKPATTGREGMIGHVGQARTALAPQGTVRVKGELWNAVAEGGAIEAGAPVLVVAVEGFRVRVRAK